MRFQPFGLILIGMTCGLSTIQEVRATVGTASIHMAVAAAVWPGTQVAGGGCPCDGDLNQDGTVNIIDILSAYDHRRSNHYRAELEIAPEEGRWKLTDIEILDEERL